MNSTLARILYHIPKWQSYENLQGKGLMKIKKKVARTTIFYTTTNKTISLMNCMRGLLCLAMLKLVKWLSSCTQSAAEVFNLDQKLQKIFFSTVRWENFKQNCKPFQQDLHRIKENDSGVPNPKLKGIESAG